MTKATNGEEWRDDWPERLADALKRQDVTSLVEFAQTTGRTTHSEIANALEVPFAPIQIMMFIRREFEDRADAIGFVADCLYRYLKQYAVEASASRARREFRAALAFGAWEAAMGSGNEQAVSEVWACLKDRVLQGWLPADPADPLLLDALSHPWRIASWTRPTASA